MTLLVSAPFPGLTADGGGVAGMLALEPEARTSLVPQLAAAVGGAYAVAAVLMALSAVAAVRGLRPSPAPRTGRTAVTGRTP